MDLHTFTASLAAATPPSGLSPAVEALWYDARDDWENAHARAQAQENRAGAWVHAYLHRKEGDNANAAYWYRRAEQPVSTLPLPAEWDTLVQALLVEPQS